MRYPNNTVTHASPNNTVTYLSNEKRKRGRPRKTPPRVRRLAHSVNEYCHAANCSRATAFRRMAAGTLKYIQEEPGSPRQIPTSEYVRHGLVQSIDEV
jgi:hypothetical protein